MATASGNIVGLGVSGSQISLGDLSTKARQPLFQAKAQASSMFDGFGYGAKHTKAKKPQSMRPYKHVHMRAVPFRRSKLGTNDTRRRKRSNYMPPFQAKYTHHGTRETNKNNSIAQMRNGSTPTPPHVTFEVALLTVNSPLEHFQLRFPRWHWDVPCLPVCLEN